MLRWRDHTLDEPDRTRAQRRSDRFRHNIRQRDILLFAMQLGAFFKSFGIVAVSDPLHCMGISPPAVACAASGEKSLESSAAATLYNSGGLPSGPHALRGLHCLRGAHKSTAPMTAKVEGELACRRGGSDAKQALTSVMCCSIVRRAARPSAWK